MSGPLIGILLWLVVIAVGFVANFYLFSQWLVFPKLRRRFRVCRPYLAMGWVLYLVGGSVLAPLGRAQHSDLLAGLGGLVAIIGIGLTVFASVRLLRANAAERRAARADTAVPSPEGTWPPPPNNPPA